MIATYQERTIEAVKREDGNWYSLIDGQESGIPYAKYKGWAIKWAMQAIDEQEQTKRFITLKEVMP